MEIIEGQTFVGESLVLDDKHFSDCKLISCILEYHGGDVVFERTHISACRHVFYGRARTTLHYLQHVGLVQYELPEWGEFDNRVN